MKIIALMILFFGNLVGILHGEGLQKSMFLLPGLGNLNHPVSTKNPEAQRFFDQGLTFIYAFNHDAAYGSFLRAAQLDPELAMAYWGMALALGQNINIDINQEQGEQAFT